MISHRFLILDSRDRQSTSSLSNDCFFILQNSDLFGSTSIELLNFSCPLTMYNINATNNIIYLNDGTNHVVTIPPGNYNIVDLQAVLKALLDTASTITFTISYTDITMKLQIDGDAPFSFMFGTYIINSASDILGFLNIDTTPTVSLSSTNSINLSIPLYINIYIDNFVSSIKSSNYYDNPTFSCATMGNNSDILTWSPGSFHQQITRCSRDNIQSLRVQLKSYGNKMIDFNNGNWTMNLKINY